jgi:hypothetical protein
VSTSSDFLSLAIVNLKNSSSLEGGFRS